MSIFYTRAWRVAYVLVCIIFVIGVGIFTLRPTATSLHYYVNGGDVTFRVDRRVLFLPTQCVNASWNAEGIEKIFFDDDATTGHRAELHCPVASTYTDPTLYVDFQGNFIQTFTIPVIVITQSAQFWLMLGFLAVLAFPTVTGFAVPPLSQDAERPITRRAFVTGLASLAALTAVGGLVNRGTVGTTTRDGWLLRETEVRR